jgi:hypothetical protein
LRSFIFKHCFLRAEIDNLLFFILVCRSRSQELRHMLDDQLKTLPIFALEGSLECIHVARLGDRHYISTMSE